jgi:uncharacterized membrane protein SirB2
MPYVLLKNVHIVLALVSIAGFVLRWTWVMTGSNKASHRVTRTLPHVIDTLFLASGIALIMTINQYPFQVPWLTAKIIGLLVYIVLGSIALKRARTSTGRGLAFAAALITFAWIVSMARFKSPWGFWQDALALIGA